MYTGLSVAASMCVPVWQRDPGLNDAPAAGFGGGPFLR